MVRLKLRKKLGLAVAAVLLVGLVATGMGQDWASILAPAKGKKCQVYLKSGEVRKGKLIKIGEDYITVEVKLSPFYAEPQTYRITQVDRIDYGSGVVDVDRYLAGSGNQQAPVAKSEQASSVASSQQVRTTQHSSAGSSGSESDDDTVQKLMAILKSLDEGPTAKPEQRPMAAATEPAAVQEGQTSSSVSQQPATQTRAETVERRRVEPASRPERARKVVVPLTRKTVQARPDQNTSKVSTASRKTVQKTSSVSRRKKTAPSPARTRTAARKRAVTRKPQPKKTIPAPKPAKTRLAKAATPTSKAVAVAQAPKTPPQGSVTSVQQRNEKQAKLAEAAGVVATSANAGGATTSQAGSPVLKAVTVLAGAVGLLALAVLALTVVVLRRHKTSAPQPTVPAAPAAAPSVQVASEEPAPQPEPAPKPPAPIHVVMVKGDYAVVDHGLDQGIKVGELLLLRRAVEDGEYEIGLARVLKVFDRLSGVKLIERWVETDLRVGDSAVRYRPAEPAPEDLTSVAVTQVGGRPHPEAATRPADEVPQMRLSSEAGTQRRNGWPM